MASTSSLLKSAASIKKKVQSQQDALVAFDWQNSAQTYEDFVNYAKYLSDRQNATSDPSQALSLAKTITTARRSYVSNELQRQTMAVMEGKATTTDKLNTVYGFYQQAIDNGDYSLAQNLASQYDSLTIKLQNEAQAAQSAAATLAMNGVKTLGQLMKKITDGTEPIQLPDGSFIKPIELSNQELKAGVNQDLYFGQVFDTIRAAQQLISDAYNGAQTQDTVDAIESKYGKIITGEETFKTAAGNLSIPEIELAYRSSLANNPVYSLAEVRNPNTGDLEYKLTKNKIDDFVWVRNDDGTYQAMETRAKTTAQSLNTKITNEGYQVGETGKNGVGIIGTGEQIKSESAATIGDRLKSQGIVATQSADGTLDLILPSGEQVKGAIQSDGSIRYFGKPGDFSGGQAGMYEINILNGRTREVAPDESSIFGQQSIFGGQISKASQAGINITKSLAGITKTNDNLLSPHTVISSVANDFTGNPLPVMGKNLQGTPTEILQSAQQVQQQMKIQTQAASPQNATVLNLNQTPVQQFAQNGAPIKQLSVTPTVTQKLTVAAPEPLQKVTVAAPTPQPKVTVTPAPAQPKLTVR